jgi:hypothetical protein
MIFVNEHIANLSVFRVQIHGDRLTASLEGGIFLIGVRSIFVNRPLNFIG